MDITGIQGKMNQVVTDTAPSQVEGEAFQSMLDSAVEAQDKEALREACREFETYYVQQLYSEMRKSIPETTLTEKAPGRDIFEDMLFEEYAKETSKGKGVGIAQMLYDQLSKKNL
ncbi:MAG: rod-binding protein [Vallitaleaceae bacterium]|jgi:flagellar protein FlgJ|nr:rod-binding protein [Vallitaleaceae bacterium]